jgi:predicted RND superfamily exporter protein
MVTPDYRHTAVWLQLRSGDNQDMSRVMDAVENWLADNPLPEFVAGRWAGKTYINVVWQGEMVSGMLRSLIGSFIVVFAMMTFLFRSIRWGLVAMLPLTITILAVYGFIGWVGKSYDMPIAVLSALTLGLSIDFAIHFIQRTRELAIETGSLAAAMNAVFEEPARAISRNAVVIALGFTPLFLAPLIPYVTVGAFMASIMVISGAATLLLLPAIMKLWRGGLFQTAAETEGDRQHAS